MNAHRKDSNETKFMPFLIKDKKHNEIWEKVNNSIKKEFDSEAAYDEKYLKTKIKSYQRKINTNFHSDSSSVN